MIRTTRSLVMIVALLFAAAGCVRTIQPILKDDQVTTDDFVIGKWITTDGKIKLDVQPAGDDKIYKVLFTDDKNQSGNFLVRLGKIDTMLVAEIHPQDLSSDASGTYNAHFLPLYTFLVIDKADPNMIVSSLSIDWLKKYIASNPTDLETARIGTDDFVVSAPTADFQSFFLKHYKDEGAMSEKTTFAHPKDLAPKP